MMPISGSIYSSLKLMKLWIKWQQRKQTPPSQRRTKRTRSGHSSKSICKTSLRVPTKATFWQRLTVS